MSPTIIAVIIAWRVFTSNVKSDQMSAIPIPLEVCQMAITNIALFEWHSTGSQWLNDLFHTGDIKPFSTLQSDYHLPGKEYYTYLQIESLLRHNQGRVCSIPWKIANYLHLWDYKG